MPTTSKLQVRLVSPWQKYCETSTAVFSSSIPIEKADALLCEWAPDEELFSFPRRKAWYCCEPACQFQHMQGGSWPELRSRLNPAEFLFHAHTDTRYRVPHITHFQPLEMNGNVDRQDRAVAIVSNHGGSPRMRHPQIAYRNRFITHPEVDLFGRSGWKTYRRSLFSWPKAPKNYQGEIPGDWPAGEKRDLQANYKGAVCLENMCEPYYFTEKFVEAVVAGCVPVYRAHNTIEDSMLKGAFWIDPADYKHEPHQVIRACLAAPLDEVQAQNGRWLTESDLLRSSHASAVFEQLGSILAND